MNIKYKQKKLDIKKLLINALLIFILLCLIYSPEIYMTSILNGLILWSKAVLPALLPFFFLSKMLTELGSVKYLSLYFEKITKKLFKVDGIGSYAFIMSIFSGYPVGAKVTCELYENGLICRNDMFKLCSFCSTSGPLFIIGTVGVGMLLNKTAGLIIFVCHFIGAILNGILWRNYNCSKNDIYKDNNVHKTEIRDDLLSYAVSNSVISVAVVGGYIALFCMFVDIGINTGLLKIFAHIIAYPMQLLNISSDYSLAFVTGLVEITRGSLEISKVALSSDFMIILISTLIAFGGISTHLQSLAFLGKHKVPYKFILSNKITQAILTGVITYVATVLI